MTQDTPTVEEIVIKICDLTGYGQALHPNDIKHYISTYGQSRYEEGVKAERERCKDLVVAHLRTNTYDGNDARVFKTTIEEVVGLLSDNK